jgi:hypothetical protein
MISFEIVEHVWLGLSHKIGVELHILQRIQWFIAIADITQYTLGIHTASYSMIHFPV